MIVDLVKGLQQAWLCVVYDNEWRVTTLVLINAVAHIKFGWFCPQLVAWINCSLVTTPPVVYIRRIKPWLLPPSILVRLRGLPMHNFIIK